MAAKIWALKLGGGEQPRPPPPPPQSDIYRSNLKNSKNVVNAILTRKLQIWQGIQRRKSLAPFNSKVLTVTGPWLWSNLPS